MEAYSTKQTFRKRPFNSVIDLTHVEFKSHETLFPRLEIFHVV